MALETKLLQKMSQSLLMTPQLQQAIKLLQLGRMEYKEAIERELLENPVLEELPSDADSQGIPSPNPEPKEPTILGPGPTGDGEEPPPSGDAGEQKVEWEGYLDSFTDYQGSASPKGLNDFEDRQPPEVVSTRTETLEQHLLEQVRMNDFSETDQHIAQHLIGNLDIDGYLECSLEEIAAMCAQSVENVSSVADSIRFLDPIGVCCRNLQECLATQLEALGLCDRLEFRIVRNHLEKLEKRRFDQIAKAEGVDLQEVSRAVHVIRKLDPRPGRAYADDTTRYIVPDIYVHKVGSDFVITLNEEGLPRLRVSPFYSNMMKDSPGGVTSEGINKTYLNERLRAATWLIKSIHQRQQTIYRVTESIMKFQREFLERGIERLKPLVLKEVADDIGMHESTVSRVTTEKYVHTPQGVFELKFFFTSGIKTASGDISSSSVKERIKAIIAAESPNNPISDQQIVTILANEKVDIARRTVAKYRETLGIASSSQRKRIL
jgi:RNA polymerase sigma-54 factor